LRPVLYGGKNWVRDFFQWYKTAGQLDVLMVPESYVTSRLDRDTLSVEVSNLDELQRMKMIPLNKEGLNISAHLEPLRIRFTTNTVGVPHLIKVSYFPNWKVQGAEGVYPVSPHLMLVIPREKEVVLTYGRSFWDIVGVVITAGTLLFLLLTGLARVKRFCFAKHGSNPPFVPHRSASSGRDALEKGGSERVALSKGGDEGTVLTKGVDRGGEIEIRGGLDSLSCPPRRVRWNEEKAPPPWLFNKKVRLILTVLVLLSAAGLIIAGAILRNKPVRTYVNGHRHYQLGNQLLDEKKVEEANRYFKSAIEAMAPIVEARHSYDHQDVIHCMLFTAMSFERLGETSKAEELYGTILKEYPYSRYVGECYVKIARGKKAGRDPDLEEALRALGGGDQAQALPLLKKTLDQTELSLAFLRKAITEDPYSVWAKYAAQDLEAERAYLKQKLPVFRGLCDIPELRQPLASLCSENPFGLR
jgi:hypothetical protein